MFECDISTTTRNLLADHILRKIDVNVYGNENVGKEKFKGNGPFK
jgi:hypothetical protein